MIKLKDNNKTTTDNQELAETVNNRFSKIIQNIKKDNKFVQTTLNLYTFDLVLKKIKKYEKVWTPTYHQNKREDEAQEYILFF